MAPLTVNADIPDPFLVAVGRLISHLPPPLTTADEYPAIGLSEMMKRSRDRHNEWIFGMLDAVADLLTDHARTRERAVGHLSPRSQRELGYRGDYNW